MVMKYLLLLFTLMIFTSLIAESEIPINKNKNNSTDSTKAAYYYLRSSENTNKNPDSSIWYAKKGLEITSQYDDEYYKNKEVQLLINTGIAYSIKSDYVRSIKYYLKAVNLSESIISQYPEEKEYYQKALIICYSNIGILYYLDKKYLKSIEIFKKSIPLIEKSGTKEQLGQLFNNIGVNYFALKKYQKALDYYQKALDFFKKTNSRKDIAMSYSNIGEVYSSINEREKALSYLKKAVEIKKETDDNYGLEVAYYNMAKLYFDEGNFENAVKYANKSLNIARIIDNQHDIINDLDLLSRSYAANNQYKEAYKSLLQLKKINDSIFNENKEKQLQELQTKYETKQKENEIMLFKEKEKKNRLERQMIISGIFLLSIIFILIIVSLYNKRKNEKKLMEKELEKKKLNEEKLNKEITFKTKQLTTHALNMMQKNSMLNDLKQQLEVISAESKPENKVALTRLKKMIETNLKSEKDWETFRIYFEQIDNGFYSRLTKMFPKLNNNDLRHCALIKLNMNLKETAAVLNLSPNTIKSARNRLKKKLNLSPEDDLSIYIRNL